MGSDNPTLLNLMQSIESGEQIGPRVLASGLIEGRSPFSVRNGIVVDRLDPALVAVRWYADHGYYGIKIYNSMPPDFVPRWRQKPIASASESWATCRHS